MSYLKQTAGKEMPLGEDLVLKTSKAEVYVELQTVGVNHMSGVMHIFKEPKSEEDGSPGKYPVQTKHFNLPFENGTTTIKAGISNLWEQCEYAALTLLKQKFESESEELSLKLV